jgi:hypothetical protein
MTELTKKFKNEGQKCYAAGTTTARLHAQAARRCLTRRQAHSGNHGASKHPKSQLKNTSKLLLLKLSHLHHCVRHSVWRAEPLLLPVDAITWMYVLNASLTFQQTYEELISRAAAWAVNKTARWSKDMT